MFIEFKYCFRYIAFLNFWKTNFSYSFSLSKKSKNYVSKVSPRLEKCFTHLGSSLTCKH
jgi:hypothetical protein